MDNVKFRQGGDTETISASTTSAAATIAVTEGENLLVSNFSAVVAFVTTATTAAVATSAHTPVMPNQQIILSRPTTHTSVAVITASSTATVYVTPGWGSIR